MTELNLCGKVILFSGRLSRVRREAEKQASDAGAIVKKSYSNAVQILVTGNDTGKKVEKARANGCQIWNEIQFDQAITNGSDSDENRGDRDRNRDRKKTGKKRKKSRSRSRSRSPSVHKMRCPIGKECILVYSGMYLLIYLYFHIIRSYVSRPSFALHAFGQ